MLRALLRRTAAVAIAAIAFAGVVATPAQAVDDGFYQPAYTSTIYRVDAGGAGRPIGYDEWASAGFPAPLPAPTMYVKYAWSPVVYAVTFWQDDESTWLWERLSAAQWQRAGSPAAVNAGWIKDSYYFKWGTSSELFVMSDGIIHKLTYAEWERSGFRPADDRHNEGWLKLSWASDIARMSNLATGAGWKATAAEWQQHDFPTPAVVRRITGDQFNQYWPNTSAIVYTGPTMNRAISYNEWVGAGSPTPGRPAPGGTWDCRNFRTQPEAQSFFDFYFPVHGDRWNLDGNNDGEACESLPRR
ncbi:excalibur calcium-binding domain-containing protein [Actinokineospora sp. G85]|uniref:excalibur calcium-binding domain-containing protein n=1 Tax=Actinokineospora sp. G85 TaxID=3406626 RepID=UPI003C74892C